MENLSNLKMMKRIKKNLQTMDCEDFAELLAIYKCTVGELPEKIAEAKGLKDSQIAAGKKKGEMDFQSEKEISGMEETKMIEHFADLFLQEKIRSDKVIEGVLNDINMALDRIGDELLKQ